MKQLIAIVMLLVFQWSFAEATPPKPWPFSPIGVSLWKDLSWPNDVSAIGGVDFSLGGIKREETSVYGLAFAPLYSDYLSERNKITSIWGVQAGLGLQQVTALRGAQLGLINKAVGATGIQIGLWNEIGHCDFLQFQIGLRNNFHDHAYYGHFSIGFHNRGRTYQFGFLNEFGILQAGMLNWAGLLQIGPVNEGGDFHASILQVGMFNWGGFLQISPVNVDGDFQIGIVNINGKAMFGLLNFGDHITPVIGWK